MSPTLQNRLLAVLAVGCAGYVAYYFTQLSGGLEALLHSNWYSMAVALAAPVTLLYFAWIWSSFRYPVYITNNAQPDQASVPRAQLRKLPTALQYLGMAVVVIEVVFAAIFGLYVIDVELIHPTCLTHVPTTIAWTPLAAALVGALILRTLFKTRIAPATAT